LLLPYNWSANALNRQFLIAQKTQKLFLGNIKTVIFMNLPIA